MLPVAVSAQKDVTKFLGIPVDGKKNAMIRKLKTKGFAYNMQWDMLEGEFNGSMVMLNVLTNKNKVWRICVIDKTAVDAAHIKIRFNNLCRQFSENKKYFSRDLTGRDWKLPDDEDISVGTWLKNKEYEAKYIQLPDTTLIALQEFENKLKEIDNTPYEEEQTRNWLKLRCMLEFYGKRIEKKNVWFRIFKYNDEYRIMMYYDNSYNQPNGEDL